MLPRIAYISEPSENTERRAKARRMVQLRTVYGGAAWGQRAVLLDLSETGLRLQCHTLPDVGETIGIDLPIRGTVNAVVIWQSGGECGASFAEPISKGVVSAAILSSPPRSRPAMSPPDPDDRTPDPVPLRTEWLLLAAVPIVLLLLYALAYLPVSGF